MSGLIIRYGQNGSTVFISAKEKLQKEILNI